MKPPDQLPLHAAPTWEVVPVFSRLTKEQQRNGEAPALHHYELRYAGKCQQKASTPAAGQLESFARFCNRRQLIPRPRIQCVADAPDADSYRRKIAGI